MYLLFTEAPQILESIMNHNSTNPQSVVVKHGAIISCVCTYDSMCIQVIRVMHQNSAHPQSVAVQHELSFSVYVCTHVCMYLRSCIQVGCIIHGISANPNHLLYVYMYMYIYIYIYININK